MARTFRAAGLRVTVQRFAVPGRGHSRNVIGALDTPASCLRIAMAHTDSAPGAPGANDNASGLGVIGAIASHLRALHPPCDVWLVATGAEERLDTGSPDHLGALALARRARARGRLRWALSLDEVGRDRPFWLLGNNAFVSLVVVAIWRMWPFAFLMLMAGLQSIPGDVYEASALDGATPFKQWRRITLPMLSSVNVVLLLVMFLWVFNDFNTPYVLFGTAQPPAGDLISFRIYNSSFLTWDFGVGWAMSVLLLLFLLLVTAVYLLATRKARANDA